MDVGVRLREAREARGMSIASLSAITRLAPRLLETIERNDPSVFPPGPYAHAYVRSYAREVGLDPEETTREYFAQFPPPPEAVVPTNTHRPALPFEVHPLRPWLVPAVAVLCVALAVAASRGWRGDAPRPEEAGAVATSGQVEAALPAATTPVQPAAMPSPAAALTVTLVADGPAWITASADGKRVLYRLLAPGDRETLRGTRQVTVRVGNAGAVRWTVGGRDVGPMGPAGAVRTITITPDNAATVR